MNHQYFQNHHHGYSNSNNISASATPNTNKLTKKKKKKISKKQLNPSGINWKTLAIESDLSSSPSTKAKASPRTLKIAKHAKESSTDGNCVQLIREEVVNKLEANCRIRFRIYEASNGYCSIEALVNNTEQKWCLYVILPDDFKEVQRIWNYRRDNQQYKLLLGKWLLLGSSLSFNNNGVIISTSFDYQLFTHLYMLHLRNLCIHACRTLVKFLRFCKEKILASKLLNVLSQTSLTSSSTKKRQLQCRRNIRKDKSSMNLPDVEESEVIESIEQLRFELQSTIHNLKNELESICLDAPPNELLTTSVMKSALSPNQAYNSSTISTVTYPRNSSTKELQKYESDIRHIKLKTNELMHSIAEMQNSLQRQESNSNMNSVSPIRRIVGEQVDLDKYQKLPKNPYLSPISVENSPMTMLLASPLNISAVVTNSPLVQAQKSNTTSRVATTNNSTTVSVPSFSPTKDLISKVTSNNATNSAANTTFNYTEAVTNSPIVPVQKSNIVVNTAFSTNNNTTTSVPSFSPTKDLISKVTSSNATNSAANTTFNYTEAVTNSPIVPDNINSTTTSVSSFSPTKDLISKVTSASTLKGDKPSVATLVTTSSGVPQIHLNQLLGETKAQVEETKIETPEVKSEVPKGPLGIDLESLMTVNTDEKIANALREAEEKRILRQKQLEALGKIKGAVAGYLKKQSIQKHKLTANIRLSSYLHIIDTSVDIDIIGETLSTSVELVNNSLCFKAVSRLNTLLDNPSLEAQKKVVSNIPKLVASLKAFPKHMDIQHLGMKVFSEVLKFDNWNEAVDACIQFGIVEFFCVQVKRFVSNIQLLKGYLSYFQQLHSRMPDVAPKLGNQQMSIFYGELLTQYVENSDILETLCRYLYALAKSSPAVQDAFYRSQTTHTVAQLSLRFTLKPSTVKYLILVIQGLVNNRHLDNVTVFSTHEMMKGWVQMLTSTCTYQQIFKSICVTLNGLFDCNKGNKTHLLNCDLGKQVSCILGMDKVSEEVILSTFSLVYVLVEDEQLMNEVKESELLPFLLNSIDLYTSPNANIKKFASLVVKKLGGNFKRQSAIYRQSSSQSVQNSPQGANSNEESSSPVVKKSSSRSTIVKAPSQLSVQNSVELDSIHEEEPKMPKKSSARPSEVNNVQSTPVDDTDKKPSSRSTIVVKSSQQGSDEVNSSNHATMDESVSKKKSSRSTMLKTQESESKSEAVMSSKESKPSLLRSNSSEVDEIFGAFNEVPEVKSPEPSEDSSSKKKKKKRQTEIVVEEDLSPLLTSLRETNETSVIISAITKAAGKKGRNYAELASVATSRAVTLLKKLEESEKVVFVNEIIGTNELLTLCRVYVDDEETIKSLLGLLQAMISVDKTDVSTFIDEEFYNALFNVFKKHVLVTEIASLSLQIHAKILEKLANCRNVFGENGGIQLVEMVLNNIANKEPKMAEKALRVLICACTNCPANQDAVSTSTILDLTITALRQQEDNDKFCLIAISACSVFCNNNHVSNISKLAAKEHVPLYLSFLRKYTNSQKMMKVVVLLFMTLYTSKEAQGKLVGAGMGDYMIEALDSIIAKGGNYENFEMFSSFVRVVTAIKPLKPELVERKISEKLIACHQLATSKTVKKNLTASVQNLA